MIDAELNYPIYDKELLYFMITKDLIARQARWAEFFTDFNFLIQLLPNNKLSIKVLAIRSGSTRGPGLRVISVPIAPIEAPADLTSRVEYDVANYYVIDKVI
ncbi:unnamed protein product [Diplocarpon coronariae]